MSLPDRLTKPSGKEAELFRNLPGGKVQCTACARLCQIGEGQVGLCGIRGVVGGKLYLLVYGRVMAGHIDPIEKKPVVHYKPGSKIFSLATSGCNWLCRYCFSPETSVVTSEGIRTIEELYNAAEQSGEIGFPKNGISVISHTGRFRRISKVFKHPYSGDMLRIRPYYLPEIQCTPNHEILVYNETKGELTKRRADEIKRNDLLAIPNLCDDQFQKSKIDTLQTLHESVPMLEGWDARSPSWMLEEEGGKVRFTLSKTEGIPRFIDVDEELAELFGIYCAEGASSRARDRPNSWVVTFSFGSHEHELIYRTRWLLEKKFGLEVSHVYQGPETRLVVNSSALGVLFASLAGPNKYRKKVPRFLLFQSSKGVLRAFLEGYIRGDGFATGHGDQSWRGTTSVSREMTLGAWYVESRLGLLPRFYTSKNDPFYVIEGRTVNRHNDYVTRIMAKTGNSEAPATKVIQKEQFNLVPVRAIERGSFSGSVYNLEVEEDHTYCASFVAVSNCQNYDISQRRKIEGVEAAPEDMVAQALAYECEGLAYTYNQPTIFMEYARDVGRIARSKGLFNIFVSNGYDTPETVAMMDDFLDCITVDFKGSGETNFVRSYIGIPNADPIFQSLLEIKRRGKVHVEITDLIIPRVGESLEAAEKLCRFVYDNLGPDTPVHFLRFHPDYKMMDFPWTPVETLERHVEVGRKAGLNYVYIGNVPGHPDESTYCPGCKAVLIKRYGYEILEYNLDDRNKCRACGHQTPIVGPLSKSFAEDRFVSVIS
jgi:pyruvate formate lyase activating enzyme